MPYGPNLSSSPGGSIGTGLFVGSGTALGVGGPAGLLIAYLIIGVMLINVTQVGRLAPAEYYFSDFTTGHR